MISYEFVTSSDAIPPGLTCRLTCPSLISDDKPAPSLGTHSDDYNTVRQVSEFRRACNPTHVSTNDIELVKKELNAIAVYDKPSHLGPKAIVEIGVSGHLLGRKPTFTWTLVFDKPQDFRYVGIDACKPIPGEMVNRKHVTAQAHDAGKQNTSVIEHDSFDRPFVFAELKRLGVVTIDFLLIDGMHSIRGAFNDWYYTELLSDNGVVLIHDTNCFPGPMALMRAIDRELYDVTEPFKDDAEYGLCVVRKKK